MFHRLWNMSISLSYYYYSSFVSQVAIEPKTEWALSVKTAKQSDIDDGAGLPYVSLA